LTLGPARARPHRMPRPPRATSTASSRGFSPAGEGPPGPPSRPAVAAWSDAFPGPLTAPGRGWLATRS